MKHEIMKKADNGLIYKVEYGRRKHIYLSVDQGQLTIRVPNGTTEAHIDEVIKKKENWILKSLDRTRRQSPMVSEYRDGGIFQLLGEKYRLNIEYKKGLARIGIAEETHTSGAFDEMLPQFLLIYVPIYLEGEDITEGIKAVVGEYYRVQAAKEIKESFERMTQITGLAPNKIVISKMKRSWGRCSDGGRISINSEIIKQPKGFIDYVVLHELCHLKHLNHSKEFWNLVAFYMPDYKSWRQQRQ